MPQNVLSLYPEVPVFCPNDREPFMTVDWEKRTAIISDESGKPIFEMKDAEVPTTWSQLALNVTASKYFYGQGTAKPEKSVKDLIHRVARTMADWGLHDGYFQTVEERNAFYKDLAWLCVHQHGAFNSPVWFNVGLYEQYEVTSGGGGRAYNYVFGDEMAGYEVDPYTHPQGSACFILSIDDSINGIWQYAMDSARLFKFGSGAGADWSSLRSTHERLNGGGKPSGPVSFMRIQDVTGGTIKSGGRTRRAAIMMTLKDWHPDILQFIEAKAKEEEKAQALIRAGYDSNFNGEAYSTVGFQNANLSVRCSHAFFRAVEKDKDWKTHWVTDAAQLGPVYKARELLQKMARATWRCGDPGVQYEDTIQKWHTVPNSGPINSSNPCSEYMHLDDTACNLASLNLIKFVGPDGTFDADTFKKAVKVFIIAQEILVDRASYPTLKIARNSHLYRPLGLGYANLGATLMTMGMPYDSKEGRALCGAITAIMTGHAYTVSAEIAKSREPCVGFTGSTEVPCNRDPILRVIELHRKAAANLATKLDSDLAKQVTGVWDAAIALGEAHGYRNAQVTVLAPTGTIAFMMDCDTTGIEPDLALLKWKTLAGGGTLKLVNQSVPQALKQLGYDAVAIEAIMNYVRDKGVVEGCPQLKAEHLPVFDCSFSVKGFTRSIHWLAHIGMMAAAQPFLSGAISKTVNMPENSTVEDIMTAYIEGWKLELKALAIYRDNCKASQPLSTKTTDKPSTRKHLPDTRNSKTHKFVIDGSHEGYLTVGLYDDGTPGELFITMAKEGSTVGGMMDAFGTAVSIGLQHGVPLESFVKKFSYMRFEPTGYTSNKKIPIARSIPDYVARWLGYEFGILKEKEPVEKEQPKEHEVQKQTDAPTCGVCGAITVRAGACYLCHNCGGSSGCG